MIHKPTIVEDIQKASNSDNVNFPIKQHDMFLLQDNIEKKSNTNLKIANKQKYVYTFLV